LVAKSSPLRSLSAFAFSAPLMLTFTFCHFIIRLKAKSNYLSLIARCDASHPDRFDGVTKAEQKGFSIIKDKR